jgi:hypothetical protein
MLLHSRYICLCKLANREILGEVAVTTLRNAQGIQEIQIHLRDELLAISVPLMPTVALLAVAEPVQ